MVDAYYALRAGLPQSQAQTQVDLSGVANAVGITNDSNTANGNIDTFGTSYSANLLGSSLSFGGATFAFGTPGVNDVFQSSSQAITLPAGKFSSLRLLGTAVNYSQTGTITVHYSDGTSSTFTQTFSDWVAGFNGAGTTATNEAIAKTMTYLNKTNIPQGYTGTAYLYAYSFSLDPSKTVSSVSITDNNGSKNIEILSMLLVP